MARIIIAVDFDEFDPAAQDLETFTHKVFIWLQPDAQEVSVTVVPEGRPPWPSPNTYTVERME